MIAPTRGLLFALVVAVPGAVAAQDRVKDGLGRDLDRLKRGEQVSGVPSTDSVSPGARTVAAGTTVANTIVARGPVDVFGKVAGSVVSLSGNVTVHHGGIVPHFRAR